MPAIARKERYASAVRCGEQITRLRKARKLTLKQVAEKTGFSPQQIFLVEKGDINTPVDTLARIAGALGVSMKDVVEEEEALPLDRQSWVFEWVTSESAGNSEAVEGFLTQLLQHVHEARRFSFSS
jgi:transcriptional regulator with XRE-family HTH domain